MQAACPTLWPKVTTEGSDLARASTHLELSPRQRQVVALIAQGLSNEEIALRLGISARTVRAHCDATRRKLNGVARRRIPFEFHRLTGLDPFADSE